MYRYFSTQRPVAPGTFPKKDGCKVNNYPYRLFVTEANLYAWGHVDYEEPLTEEEAGEYELVPKRYTFNVEFRPTNGQLQEIHKLWVKWRGHVSDDGAMPFAGDTLETFFKVMMQAGSFYTINRHIENLKYDLYRKG